MNVTLCPGLDPHVKYSLDVQVKNLRAFLQGLGLSRVHLGGNSMGGGVVAFPNAVADDYFAFRSGWVTASR